MKKLISSLIFLVSAGSSLAQIFACQPTETAGFKDLFLENRWQWRVGKFNLGKPFFLKIDNDLITIESAAEAIEGHPSAVTCQRRRVLASSGRPEQITVHACNDGTNFLSWSPDTRYGTIARTYGGFQPQSGVARDSVHVTLFSCQKM